MFRTYHELASCAPSQQQDVYVFAVKPLVGDALAAITSADELIILSRNALTVPDAVRVKQVPQGLTSLVAADDGKTVICGGSDGVVALYDVRNHSRVAQFKIGATIRLPTRRIVG